MLFLIINIISFLFQSPDKLSEDIDRYLAKELPGYEKIEFKIAKLPENYKRIEIIESANLNITGNTAYVPIKLTNKENKTSQTFLTVNVKLYKTVLVAKDRIERKKILNSGDFDVRLIDVAGLRGKLIALDSKIENYRSKTIIRKDDILVAELIEDMPAIFTGDRVKAYFVNGTVTIDFDVNARQDGKVGDLIRVVTHDNKQYKAKVVDSKNVIINE